MSTRWRGLRIYLLSFVLIAGLAMGKYTLDTDPGALPAAWHWLLAQTPLG